jgi:hypothetical protein
MQCFLTTCSTTRFKETFWDIKLIRQVPELINLSLIFVAVSGCFIGSLFLRTSLSDGKASKTV